MHPDDVNEILVKVRDALESGHSDEAIRELLSLHPVDQAETFLELNEAAQKEILTKLDSQARAELFEQMGGEEAAEVAGELPPHELAEVLDEMSPEDAADILGELSSDHQESTLAQMEEAFEVKPLLQYPEDSAGGIMSPEFLALEQEMTTDDVIALLRREHADAGTPYYLYVVSDDRQLVGVVALRELITASPETKLSAIMNPDVLSVSVHTDQEELANLMKRYRLLLLPVVDEGDRLVGIVKNSDLVDVIEEEATEDIYRLAGVADGQIQVWSPFRKSIGRRLPWLYVNLFTAFLAAWVVSRFQATLEQFAVLAVFQGIIAGQGGNAATQTLTIMVRGLALGEIEFRDVFKALGRELVIGAFQGVAVGSAVGLGAYLWMGMPFLGVIAALSLTGNMIAAAFAGTVVPLSLRALRLDPALASGVLVTTVTDCVGFGLFLYLATLFLPLLK